MQNGRQKAKCKQQFLAQYKINKNPFNIVLLCCCRYCDTMPSDDALGFRVKVYFSYLTMQKVATCHACFVPTLVCLRAAHV